MTAAALSFIGGGIGPIPGHGVNAAFLTFRAGAMSRQARGPGRIGFLVGAAAILFFCMFADLAAAYTLKSDEGNFTAVKGKLQSHGRVTQAGLSGRESRVFIPRSNLIMRQRIFIKGDRLYQNIYVGPPGSEDGQDVETFFASFRLAN